MTDWVIRKNGYFYRPNAQGYTVSVLEAGRYTREEAEAHAAASSGEVTAHPASEFPASPSPAELKPEWHDGVPGKPWADEWFIAETTYGDRVVLCALPEKYTYDFMTADDTYIKAEKIKRWMQFPDSEFSAPPNVSPTVPEPVYKAVERILDEESAWIARPDDAVTKRVAFAATLAAHTVLERVAELDASEIAGADMIEAEDPTSRGDRRAEAMRQYYENHRETWWQRLWCRTDQADNLMLGLLIIADSTAKSLPRREPKP